MKNVRKYLREILATYLNTDQINDLGRHVDPSFDVRTVSGFGHHIVIPRKIAADCILSYFQKETEIIKFIEFLLNRRGLPASGGIIQLQGSDQKLIRLLADAEYVYDEVNGRLIQDQTNRKSEGWGYFQPGQEADFVFVSIDVIMSSELARINIRQDVENTMSRFRHLVFSEVEKYNGRIWKWYGDGGLAVFLQEDGTSEPIACMVRLLSRLPLFNIMQNEMRPGSEIRLRIGISHGKAAYAVPVDQITSADLELAQEIEKNCAAPNSIAMSGTFYRILPPEITKVFQSSPPWNGNDIYIYHLE